MKLLNLDGSVFGEAPEWLLGYVKSEGQSFFVLVPSGPLVAFVRLSHGIRFWSTEDRQAWIAAKG